MNNLKQTREEAMLIAFTPKRPIKVESKSYEINFNFKPATIYVDHVQGPKLSSMEIQG
jgi:hypothetical protein